MARFVSLGKMTIRPPTGQIARAAATDRTVHAEPGPWPRIGGRSSGFGNLSALAEATNYAVTTATIDGVLTEWNLGAERLYGYTAAEMVGKSLLHTIVPPERADERQRLVQTWLRGDIVLDYPTVRRTKDGRRVDVSMTIIPIRDRTSAVIGSTSITRDITHERIAERALQVREERFRTLFDDAAISTSVIGPDGYFREANRAFCALLGYSREELLKMRFSDLTHPDDREASIGRWKRITAGRFERTTAEKRFVGRDGRTVWVLANSASLRDADGVPLVVNQYQDITDRKAAEDALKESEARLRSIFNDAASPIEVVAPDGRFLRVNPAMCRMTGYTEAELLQMRAADITHPDDRERYLKARTAAGRGNAPIFQMEKRYLSKAGDVIWVFVNVSLLRDPDGQVIYSIGQIQNLTERKQAEEELRRNRDRLVALVDEWIEKVQVAEGRLLTAINTIPDGFALYDAKGALVLTNRRLLELYPELEGHAVPGTPIREILELTSASTGESPKQRERRLARFQQGLTDADDVRLKNGQWIWRRQARSGDGFTVSIESDVTPYKLAEATLARQSRRLQKALTREREVGALHRQFVSIASHEFRTPLAIINSSAERLLRHAGTMPEATVRQKTEKIKNAVRRMTGLIETMLTAEQLDGGQFHMTWRRFNIAGLLRQMCAQYRELSPGHTIHLETAQLPGEIDGDPDLLDNVFSNLLSNAVKYAPGNTVIGVKGWTEKNEAVITFEDRGRGIPADELPRLFTRFFRASTSKGVPGTGLGLYMVKQVIEMHGGRIAVESVVDKGTLFSVRLPVKRKAPPPVRKRRKARRKRRAAGRPAAASR